MNSLKDWFYAHTTGPGIWKWDHYLDVYDKYFSKFRGREVHVCEVGIYSGGSLDMWREYFGPSCTVYGVDIQPACLKFERDWCKIHIGNQGDREFWKNFKQQVPRLDILIDDGSHDPNHQILTMHEILPHLSPGGVYICEDVLNDRNAAFGLKASAMAAELHENVDIHATDMLAMGLTERQKMVHSVHVYPHVVVVEKWDEPPARFEAPGYGSEWIWQDPGWKP
jgi:hypothetical protein